jgi:hypothetical protein
MHVFVIAGTTVLLVATGASELVCRQIVLARLATSTGSPPPESTILNGERPGIYPVVASTSDGALIAVWTEVGRDSQPSSIAMRRIESRCSQSSPRTTD